MACSEGHNKANYLRLTSVSLLTIRRKWFCAGGKMKVSQALLHLAYGQIMGEGGEGGVGEREGVNFDF